MVGLNTADLKLAIQLKELDLRVKQQEHDTQLLRVRQCELEARRFSPRPVSELQAPMASVPSGSPVVSPVPHTPGTGEVDISRQIRLVPIFRETEIDSYFSAFERIATALHWPREIWSLLLQCRLTGKAQEVSAALSIEDSLDQWFSTGGARPPRSRLQDGKKKTLKKNNLQKKFITKLLS